MIAAAAFAMTQQAGFSPVVGVKTAIVPAAIFIIAFSIVIAGGLTSFAAAAISKGAPLKTGFQAFFYSIRATLLPGRFIHRSKRAWPCSRADADADLPNHGTLQCSVEIGTVSEEILVAARVARQASVSVWVVRLTTTFWPRTHTGAPAARRLRTRL